MPTESSTERSTSRTRVSAIVIGVVAVEVVFFASAAVTLIFMTSDSKAFENVALALGTLATVVGTFIGARFAGTAPLRHALVITAVVFVISFVRFVTFQIRPPANASAVHPLWWEIAGWVLLLAAGTLGGALARGTPQER